MRNKIIESTIEQVVDQSQIPSDAKALLKKYVINKFDDNASESDLKQTLAFIEVNEEDEDYENVNSWDWI